ncbi:MAG: hypothetical protein HFJ52_02325 [Clostridia bacterium]|nr:hypothetical protein [Clostridia bacterium]
MSEEVKFVIDIIKRMSINEKLRLALNMTISNYLSLEYDTTELCYHYDCILREIDEDYRKCYESHKFFTVNFTMAKLIEMKKEGQNQVALFLFNEIETKLNKTKQAI